MFKYTKNGAGETVVRFEDRNEEECCFTFDVEGTGCVEIDIECFAVLTKEQAIAVANLILEQTK